MIEVDKKARYIVDNTHGYFNVTCFIGTAENGTLQWGYGKALLKSLAKKIAYIDAKAK